MQLDGVDEPVCCGGCRAVAQLIIEGGNAGYYQYREGAGRRMQEQSLASLEHWRAFDEWYAAEPSGVASVDLLIEGLHCGACAWLIESRLTTLAGVEAVEVDLRSGAGTLRWRPDTIRLGHVLAMLVRLGYQPHPLADGHVQRAQRQERDALLKRLAVSGLGMMQVTMFAVATYLGATQGIDPAIERLLLGVSMLVATPVVFYAGAPFLSGAMQALTARQLNMDVPVALALLLAFGASSLHFFSGSGETYFESVSMFVFFLLCGRYLAMLVRHRALEARLALAPMLPDVALRLAPDAREGEESVTPVPRQALRPGDRIRVRAGEAIAADGVVESGRARVDESLLSGESVPVDKSIGQTVTAASINLDGSLVIRVSAGDEHNGIARTADSLERVRQDRPRTARLAERMAGRFVFALLIVAALVGVAWWVVDAERALPIVLAVLVVTCPCALSLAIPTAQSAAATRLAQRGLLVQRLDALEVLPKVTLALFDKTGTLTTGNPQIAVVAPHAAHRNPVDSQTLIGLIASLERHTTHPLANAFGKIPEAGVARRVETISGGGMRGEVAGRQLKLGHAEFVDVGELQRIHAQAQILVSDQDGFLGSVTLQDRTRDDAAETLRALSAMGIECEIVSGDRAERVFSIAAELGASDNVAECSPERKLALLRERQHSGAVVLAVGDGVNDAGFLAGADVSVAVASGAQLAQCGADLVLTGESLSPIAQLPAFANQLGATVRQNLYWAVGYNLLAVPFAAIGLIGPGLAALGMSASSLLVVLNSARLARSGRARQPI